MADFALGLTKSAVQGTLNRVKLAIEEEGKLRVRVQDDLVFISGEFLMMQSFLRASNAGGRASQDEVVQAWVRQLRDLAFDVEDCVEFVIHLDKSSPWDWVRHLASTLPCVAGPPLPLDVAVAEIKRLKVRVEDLSERNARYNLFSGGGGDSSDQQQHMHLVDCTTSSSPATTDKFHVLRDVWKAMGKLGHTIGKLKRLIDCEGNELKVISLWRSQQADVVGELGWVTIAKKAYDDPEICQEFKNRAWVKLSTHHPFNPVEFLNKLLSQFTKSLPDHHHHEDISKLMLQVSQHRYLVVLETELSSAADWDAIRGCLPDGKNGSRIIVSTKHLEIALVCTGNPYQLSELKRFSHDRYLCAIFPKGSGHRFGIGELFWQLRRPCGVMSLFWRTNDERKQLVDELYYYQSRRYRAFNGVKFELHCHFDGTEDGPFKVVNLALFILVQSYPEDEQEKESKDLREMNNDLDIYKKCRKFLTEHDCLVFIQNMESVTDWNLIRKHLLCESTRGYIVVMTSKQSVATHCVDHKQHRVLNVEELVKGCGHRIGMSELFWQLKRHDGVVSLFWRTDEERSDLMDKLYSCQYSVFEGVKVELHCCFDGTDGLFKLVDLALFILAQLYSEDEQEKECKELRGMNNDQDIIEMGRKFLTEHDCLIFITNLESTTDWNLIKKHLLCKSTRGYIVVITSKQSVATHCVDHEQDRVLNVEELMKGCGHRTGMGELFWQLRRPCGVISLFSQTDEEREQLVNELYSYQTLKYRVFDGVKFEHNCCFNGTEDGLFKLIDLAMFILVQSYPEDEKENASEQLKRMNSDQDIIEMCRKFLTEHDCLVFISSLKSTADWDLIKQKLLCDSTRGCIVVITSDQSVATHCVDHEQDRVLNVEDLLEESDQQDQSGLADGKSELDTLVRCHDDGNGILDELRGGETLPVVGIAGVGKSTHVRLYYNQILLTQVYRMHGWVDVPHPFNLTDLCQRLLLDLYSDDVDAKEAVAIGMLEGQDPIQGCIEILLEHKCLLVFDGLRSTHDWDLIKATLLSRPISGSTIVITREDRIAKHCRPDASTLIAWVCSLTTEEAFKLFTKIILNGKPLFPKAEEISKIIMSKCGGLPEVIVAIGKQIRPVAQQADSLLQILKTINDDFMGYLQKLPNLRGLLSWMQSYFDACSDELKPCIFYLSIFPADQSIRMRRLLMRWVAEGYLSGGTADGKGVNLMLQLERLSILYQTEEEISTMTFKLNDFFREYIKSRPMEDNRVFELDGSCNPSVRLTGQHLSISSSWDRDEIVFQSLDLSRLRSFTVSGDWRPFLICDKMKLLRVLDLEGTSTSSTNSVTDGDLEQIGKLLPRLKFMSLRGCIHITRLPDSLGDMKQLETLDAKHTSVVELPHAVHKLHKLQYILLGTIKSAPTGTSPPPTPTPQEHSHDGTSPSLGAWKKMADDLEECCGSWWQSKNQRRRHRVAANGRGVEVARAAAQGIGELTGLHTLGVVNVAAGKGAFLFLKELKKLTHLCKLWLSGITRKNWQQLCSAISGHRHLETLSLQLLLLEDGSYDFACFDDISEPPTTLKRLKILYTVNAGTGASTGGARIRPTWIKKLRNMERFFHELTLSSQEDIDIMKTQSLPESGDCVRIKPIEQHLSFDNGLSFDALRIDCSSISSTVTFGGSESFDVKEINIHCCSSCGSSCLRIFGLKCLQNLEQVLVTGPCNNEYEQDLRTQLEEHPNEPEVKLL